MGDIFKPSVETKQPKSQATPLSGDILEWLRSTFQGGVGGDTLGQGIGAPQQAAGENISDFIAGSKDLEAFNEMLGPLRKSFGRETQRGEAAIKESMGALGNRFSTSTQKNVGQFRGERASQIESLIADMFLRNQSNLLGAIGQQQQFGIQNLQPFFDFAGLGILPEDLLVGDSPFSQIANPLAQGAGAFFGAGG